jgi:hypothetical protein
MWNNNKSGNNIKNVSLTGTSHPVPYIRNVMTTAWGFGVELTNFHHEKQDCYKKILKEPQTWMDS